MGYYIEAPRNKLKAEWLEVTIPEAWITKDPNEAWDALLSDHGVVCVVDNGPFEAAGFCFSKKEFSEFANPEDSRPKKWVVMPRTLAEDLSGFNGREARSAAYDDLLGGISDD